MFLQLPQARPTIQPEIIFTAGHLSVTNAMLMGVAITIGIFFFGLWARKQTRLKATKGQTVLEMIVEGMLSLLESISGSRQAAEKLLPLIGTLFLFLGLGNLVALIPGVTAITVDGVSLFRTATNDFNMTFSIALAMVLLTQWASMKQFGVFGHLGKFIKIKGVIQGFKKGIGAGCIAVIDFGIGLLDIVSEIAKVVSLSLRLFGNMFAGDMLAAILLGALAVVVPAPWLAMNIFVGVLQAIVFGALCAAYYTLAVQTEEQATQET